MNENIIIVIITIVTFVVVVGGIFLYFFILKRHNEDKSKYTYSTGTIESIILEDCGFLCLSVKTNIDGVERIIRAEPCLKIPDDFSIGNSVEIKYYRVRKNNYWCKFVRSDVVYATPEDFFK